MKSDYALVSTWTVACAREDLWVALDGLLASSDPMAWWPAVQVRDYDGTAMAVRVSSGLGYSLDFTMCDLDAQQPSSLTFTAVGDLRGSASVAFHEVGSKTTRMNIVWCVSTDRRWMRRSAWLLRPVFVAAHHLVMRKGERQLNRWLATHV
jgi:hypothetical protein